jgi:hypothetical protein
MGLWRDGNWAMRVLFVGLRLSLMLIGYRAHAPQCCFVVSYVDHCYNKQWSPTHRLSAHVACDVFWRCKIEWSFMVMRLVSVWLSMFGWSCRCGSCVNRVGFFPPTLHTILTLYMVNHFGRWMML